MMVTANANTVVRNYPGAGAFLNYGRQFYEGAEIIHANKAQSTPVLYSMYFHAVECLLKAYLTAHGIERWGHNLSELCAEAQQLGLQIDRDKAGGHDLHNVAALLGADKGDAGFRYFTWESRSMPELAWTREVVADLLRAVASFVESTTDKARAGVPVKFDITMKVV
jgi:HEPN domain